MMIQNSKFIISRIAVRPIFTVHKHYIHFLLKVIFQSNSHWVGGKMLCVYVGFIGQQESLQTVLSSGSFTGSGPAWTHLRLNLHLHTAPR